MKQEAVEQLKVVHHGQRLAIEERLETHISWVLMTGYHAYKIKKPLKTTFLDYSTLEKRKYYCEREIQLNQRLTQGIYLEAVPVFAHGGTYFIGDSRGDVIDYAVKMRKMNRFHQMDILLEEGKVTAKDITKVAQRVASFHKSAQIVHFKLDAKQLKEDFNDLVSIDTCVRQYLSPPYKNTIERACSFSDEFIEKSMPILHKRMEEGCYRDCHGDLHAKNIILEKDPVIFDCIEFNDSFRHIDVLNEIAFCCMELEVRDQQKLSDLFLQGYLEHIGFEFNLLLKKLLVYYKMYRANVRAKVTGLKLMEGDAELSEKQDLEKKLKAYFNKMMDYHQYLSANINMTF